MAGENGDHIGDMELIYNPRQREMEFGRVTLASEALREKGYGKAMYRKAGSMTTYEGTRYSFVSSMQISEDAIRVWESFVRDGVAIKRPDGRYEMLDTQPEEVAA